ncbi:MAG: CPBP family intramembrane metalloprotease [Deltaproteobacteria bacterium]|nr:CPBP family intramembrane metalloprotease [Deltaproteobacteria bacterium]
MRLAEKNAEREATARFPDRYSIRKRGEHRELVCSESPTMAVRIEAGMTVPAAAARKAPPGTIYLDGAAEGGPFLDVEKAVFNLDHHEGCLRSLTLATCEQAMVLVRKGLDLQTRDWTIYANDPDLDTLLAIWVLLNHMRLNEADPEIRRKIMPLVRLEGVIDAHGLELQELCGFPPEVQEFAFAELEQLRRDEAALKREGRWHEIDFLEYAADTLRAVDEMIYSSHHFEGVLKFEEMARADIGENQLAVVCRAETGVYEMERYLRRLHGKRLGVIAFQKDSNTYTLRQVNTFLPATLESAYERLNLIDPAAGNRRSGNRWGGSGEIGGSPRASGTSLTPQEIADIVAQAYRGATTRQRVGAVILSALGTAFVMVSAIMATYLLGRVHDPAGSIESYLRSQSGTYAAILCALTGALAVTTFRSGPKLFGLSMPVGFDWLIPAPVALLAGWAGGGWVVTGPLMSSESFLQYPWTDLAVALALPAAAEALFRGLAHGTLAQHFPTQHNGGRWFLSWPVVISSLLYAPWSLVPFFPFFSRGVSLTVAGALLFGLSSGMARERSESLLPCLILHWSCVLTLVVTARYF